MLLRQAEAALFRGEFERGRQMSESALLEDPSNVTAHFLIGSIEAQAGALQLAKNHLEKCVSLGAQFPQAYIHLGNVYRLTGDMARAADAYREALQLDPTNELAQYSLALMLKATGAHQQALNYLEALALSPALRGDVARLRAKTLVELGRYEEAVDAARAAVELCATCYDSQIALGYAYQKLHQANRALECYDVALVQRNDDAELLNNRGIVLQDLGRVREAIASYESALKTKPDFSLARFHRGLANLLLGNYGDGWPDYETRLISADLPKRTNRCPRWQGERLEDKTILVYGEQGLGDEIMFASCLPDLITRSNHCIVECSSRLEALFSRSFPAATVLALDVPANRASTRREVDFETAIGSLPLHFRRSRASFPMHCGYLKADASRIARWRETLDVLGPGLKIGLSWKGGTHKTREPLRSIPLERLLPILSVPNARYVSLQYTPDAPVEIATFQSRHGITIAHWQEAIDDYDETAALVCALDLIITVCTSLVHLVGALGKTAWVATPHVPEWRYGLTSDGMPWYPTVRLFRQAQHGSWSDVVEGMRRNVHQLAAAHSC
jgi:tetratricopeptide (TPR) repeat protein